MPPQRRVLAHRNRRALTVHAAGASTPRTRAAPAGGRLSRPTRPPRLTTRLAGASNDGRRPHRRPRPSFPRKIRTPGRRRPGPRARQRPSTVATLPPHSPHSPRSTPSPTSTSRPTSSPRFVPTLTPAPPAHTPRPFEDCSAAPAPAGGRPAGDGAHRHARAEAAWRELETRRQWRAAYHRSRYGGVDPGSAGCCFARDSCP